MKLFLEDGEEASLEDVLNWWLERYEGLEHLTEGGRTTPETWYTINTILRRNLERLKK